ncbi:hypothetical protein MMC28_003896 [Mycoblastus sanguinarius]|nr:hypothetical protein [Mycoblastus sanguinarius]
MLQGTYQPHFPFTRPFLQQDNFSAAERKSEEEKREKTVEHAQVIVSQHDTLASTNIQTAEALAKLVNSGNIHLGLLAYLTSPKPKNMASPASKKARRNTKKKLEAKVQAESTGSIQEIKDEHSPPNQEGVSEEVAPKEGTVLGDPVQEQQIRSESAPKQRTVHKEPAPEKGILPEEPSLNRGTALTAPTLEQEIKSEQRSRAGIAPKKSAQAQGSASPKPPSSQPGQSVGGRAHGLKWCYATHTAADTLVEEAGIWLWRKPTTYYQPQPLYKIQESGTSVLAPVIIDHGCTGTSEPLIEFDGKKVRIVPHLKPWDDIRSSIGHPDFIVPCKRVEYQACESAGYQIWRHDREVLNCRKSGCDATISDHDRSTIICLGCGPKTVVRYCSLAHQVEDIEEHWKECGHESLVMERVIDHTTEPTWFSRKFPAIKECQGYKSPALYRQKLYAMLAYGHYTLFDPVTQEPSTLFWPKAHPKQQEMDERIERVLNIAFFDIFDDTNLIYLYRLLRELLRESKKWVRGTIGVLNGQFAKEFGEKIFDVMKIDENPPCECEWVGRDLQARGHVSHCQSKTGQNRFEPSSPEQGLRAVVEQLEEEYWILRAWRQQHPTQKTWSLRAAGHGFLGLKPEEDLVALGPGWR